MSVQRSYREDVNFGKPYVDLFVFNVFIQYRIVIIK
jgi:hypothetical protein